MTLQRAGTPSGSFALLALLVLLSYGDTPQKRYRSGWMVSSRPVHEIEAPKVRKNQRLASFPLTHVRTLATHCIIASVARW
jgi:hypothetical protein